MATRLPGRPAPEQSGPSPPLSTEAWDAMATLATQQAYQSRQSTAAGAQHRPILASRAVAGQGGHPEGRGSAEDGPAVDAPSS